MPKRNLGCFFFFYCIDFDALKFMTWPPSIPIHWLLTTKQNQGQSQKRLICRNYAFRYMFVSFTVKKNKKQPRLHFDNSYPLRTVYFTLKKSFIIRSVFGSTFCSFLCILLKHWSNFVHFLLQRGSCQSKVNSWWTLKYSCRACIFDTMRIRNSTESFPSPRQDPVTHYCW